MNSKYAIEVKNKDKERREINTLNYLFNSIQIDLRLEEKTIPQSIINKSLQEIQRSYKK